MKGYWLLGMIALGVLSLAAACQSTLAPTDTPTAIPSPVPTIGATTMPEPTNSPAPDTPEPTEAPTPTETPTPSSVATEAGNADVLNVRAVQTGDDTWAFHVSVEHPDTGWEDYADGWDVVTPDGEVIKPDPDSPFTRLLLHPHENEQPFTRSQSGIAIPEGVTQVRVRAHDLVDGYGGREVVVDLTVNAGPDFEVER